MANQPKFTPGPWSIDRRGNYQDFPHLVGGKITSQWSVVAEIAGAVEVHGEPHAINLADANLIAAAPDLYGALINARSCLYAAVQAACDLPDFDPSEHIAVKRADAALAKAEGRS